MVKKKLTIDMFVKPSELERSESRPNWYVWPDEAYYDDGELARMPDGRYLPSVLYVVREETGEEFPMIYEPCELCHPGLYGYDLPSGIWTDEDYEKFSKGDSSMA